MGTMNFSIPDDVKDAFNEAFKDRNKSEIVTNLMRQAIEREQRRQKSESFVERMRRIRARATRTYTDEEIRAIREDLRK
ncbi:MAG TPA: hypothetical protein VJ045_05590 [Hyphomicrobiaceae bacterium]|nr:hypothetical protein [Hyphomicrobiaceae bacterium]